MARKLKIMEKENCCAHSTGQEERRCYRILLHTFIQSCFFFLHISPLFISPLFISPLFISPLFLYLLFISPLFISPLFLYLPCLYLPCFYISLVFISPPNPGPLTLLYSQFPSTHSRPRHLTRHAASANQGSRGKSSNWIHLYPGTPAQHSRCLCLI